MGLTVTVFSLLALLGLGLRWLRLRPSPEPLADSPNSPPLDSPLLTPDSPLPTPPRDWSGLVRSLHVGLGIILVALVVGLMTIGIVGTLGHFGSLGHSPHLGAGLAVVALTVASAWSASRINPDRPWARPLHLTLNGVLAVTLAAVSWTGWIVVQKYLP